jgi:SagB-type dehydrogenase family enzyme
MSDELELLRQIAGMGFGHPRGDRSSLAESFHLNTNLNRLNAPAYAQSIRAAVADPVLGELMTRPGKTFSLVEESLELPTPAAGDDLERAIAGRRSARVFSGEPVPLAVLARLLFFTYGRRAVPSAGALYPLEIYLLVFAVAGLPAGIYHYDAPHHRLRRLRATDPRPEARRLLLAEGVDLERAGAVVLVSAVLARTLLKYRDRGYRMVLIEAGEAAQNLSLLAERLDLGTVWLGGFYDEELAAFLGNEPVGEPVLLAGVLGTREESR